MDGRRISASPRPCCGRRVVAKKRPRGGDGFVNSVRKIQRREICSKRDRAFSMSDAQERFRNIRLQVCPFSDSIVFLILLPLLLLSHSLLYCLMPTIIAAVRQTSLYLHCVQYVENHGFDS